jgi:glycosyltransferase involved in cell wall biosynthesis
MATARPVIAASKVGGARDLVRDGVNGWTFQSASLEELTTVIKRALGCAPETLAAMGAAAELDSARWSIPAAAAGIEAAVMQFTRHIAHR